MRIISPIPAMVLFLLLPFGKEGSSTPVIGFFSKDVALPRTLAWASPPLLENAGSPTGGPRTPPSSSNTREMRRLWARGSINTSATWQTQMLCKNSCVFENKHFSFFHENKHFSFFFMKINIFHFFMKINIFHFFK